MTEGKAAIATPETDVALAREYRTKGATAKKRGTLREACPYDGLIKRWWLEGWDDKWPAVHCDSQN